MASANQRLSALLPSWSVSVSSSSHTQALHLDIVSSISTTPASSSARKKVRFVAFSPFGPGYHDRRRQSYHHSARSEEDISSSPGSESFDTDQQSSEPTISSLHSYFELEAPPPPNRTKEVLKITNERQEETTIRLTNVEDHCSHLTRQAIFTMASNPAPSDASEDPSGGRPNLDVQPEREQEVKEVFFTEEGIVRSHLVPVLRYGAPHAEPLGAAAYSSEHRAAGAMVSPSSSSSPGVDNGLSMRERLTRNTRRMLHSVGHVPPRPRRSSQRPVTADAVFQAAHVVVTLPETRESTPRPPTRPASPPDPVITPLDRRSDLSPPLAPQIQETSQTYLSLPISPFDLQHSQPGSRGGSSPFSDDSKWTYGNVPSREDLLSLSSFVSDGDARHGDATLEYLTANLPPPRPESHAAIDYSQRTSRGPTGARTPVPRQWHTALSPATAAVTTGLAVKTEATSSLTSSAIPSAGISAMENSRVKKGFAFFGGGSISRKKGEGFTDQQSSISPDDQHTHTQDAFPTSGAANPRRRLSHFRTKPSTSDGIASAFGIRKSSAASSSQAEGSEYVAQQRSDRIESDDASYAPISRASVGSVSSSNRQRLPFGSLSSTGTGSLQSWTHNSLATTFTRFTQRRSDAQEEEVLTPKSTYAPSLLPEESTEPLDSSPFPSGQPGMASVASSSQEALLDARYSSQLDLGPDQDSHTTPAGKAGVYASTTEASMSTVSQYPSFHSFASDAPLVQPEASISATIVGTQRTAQLEPSAADKLVAAAQQFKRVATRERKDRYSVAMPDSYLNYDPNSDPDGILGILEETPKTESAASTPKYAEIPLAAGTPIDIRPAPLSIHQLIEERTKPLAVVGASKRSDILHKLIHKRNPPVGLGIVIPPDPEDPSTASRRTAPVVHSTMQAKIQAPMDRIMDRKSKEKKMDAKDSLKKQKEAILKELAEQKSRQGELQENYPSQNILPKNASVNNDTAQHGLRTFKDHGSASQSSRRSRPQTAPTSTDSYYVHHPDILSSKSPIDSPVIPIHTPKRRGLVRRMFSKEGLIRQLGLDKYSKSKVNAIESGQTPAEDVKESYEAQEARLLATAEDMATPVRESFNSHLLQQRPSAGEHLMSESTSAASMIPLTYKPAPASNQSMFTAQSDIARDDSFAPPSPARTSSDIAGRDMSSVTSSILRRASYDGSRILAPSPRRPIRHLSRLQSSPAKCEAGGLPATPTKRRPGDVLPLTERPIDTISEEGNSRLAALNNPELNVYLADTITRVLSGGERDLHKTMIVEDSGSASSDSSSADAKEIALLQERLLRAQARREERRLQREALRARLAIKSEDDREMRDPNLKPCDECGCVCSSTSKRRDKGKQGEV
ncbi:hypothetical protein QFC21_001665 [Naganishia friedmannii]|uniref:Uncharacterized protein n=1 Tax=Naganishia friedmannii TaxID=89922 RepID=A0ACC2W2H6_9TREE|nr:hypothetical protein QFC21_001665 [Naganishia friedmannii]